MLTLCGLSFSYGAKVKAGKPHIAGLRRGTRATYMDYRNVCGTGWKCVLRLFLRLPVGCARLV